MFFVETSVKHTYRTEVFKDTKDGQTYRTPPIRVSASRSDYNQRHTIYINTVYIYDTSYDCPAKLMSLLFAEDGMGSSYTGLPGLLVSKRGHKYVTFGVEGVPRNSDMRQLMYGNKVCEHKVACRTVALLR